VSWDIFSTQRSKWSFLLSGVAGLRFFATFGFGSCSCAVDDCGMWAAFRFKFLTLYSTPSTRGSPLRDLPAYPYPERTPLSMLKPVGVLYFVITNSPPGLVADPGTRRGTYGPGNPRKINTCESLSKQMTLTSPRFAMSGTPPLATLGTHSVEFDVLVVDV
jgi:hypothetical protein